MERHHTKFFAGHLVVAGSQLHCHNRLEVGKCFPSQDTFIFIYMSKLPSFFVWHRDGHEPYNYGFI